MRFSCGTFSFVSKTDTFLREHFRMIKIIIDIICRLMYSKCTGEIPRIEGKR